MIALWLGHESLDTTHMYIQADLKTKEQALGKLQPVEGGFSRFKPDDALLASLSAPLIMPSTTNIRWPPHCRSPAVLGIIRDSA